MTILDGGADNTIAAYDANRKRLVIVTSNFGWVSKDITHDLTKFAAAAGPITQWSTNLDDSSTNYVKKTDISISDKKFTAHVAKDSVQTFEIAGVDLSKDEIVV